MPVDYSKWDALELSDDSDIEVHPNVDKRSFIRAKQNQIHAERQQRKHQIEALKYQRQVNDGLMTRITTLLSSLRAHAAELESDSPKRTAAEIAFQAVMETGANVKPEDDKPPPVPEGVQDGGEPMTYTKMMAALLDTVNKSLAEKKLGDGKERYDAMMEELEGHVNKIKEMNAEGLKKRAELEAEEGKKITSESIHTGFDSSHVTKSKPEDKKPASAGSSDLELLNPGFGSTPPTADQKKTEGAEDDDEDMECSPEGKQFGSIKANNYQQSFSFLTANPQVLSEREQDGLMVLGFVAALEGKNELSRQYVHQALLLQYCRQLGRDGVQLFFKRIMTPGHQAREMFSTDVQQTYGKIYSRSREIISERARDEAEGRDPNEVETIQLHAVEPGTTINISIPPADSEDEEVKAARAIFESFKPDMRKALETGNLETVNKALGKLKVDEAEDLVGKLGEAGILSLEEEIIDATNEEGKARLKEIESGGAAALDPLEETGAEEQVPTTSEPKKEEYGDPE